jgi:protein-S-isoprenylcysteine O-methyltransferase Ste14
MHASSRSPDEGDRGGRWVVAQFALMGLVVGAGFLPPGWGGLTAVAALGAVLSLLGLLLLAWSWISLERAATPFPQPKPGARLVEGGPYAFVRHPMYVAALLFFLGYGLATSPAALVPLAALGLLFRNKAAFEEELLVARYAGYREYRERVPGAFVPRG